MLYFPVLCIYGLGDLLRKFCNSFRMFWVPMVTFAISVALHPTWNKLIVIDRDMGITGIAMAGFITFTLNFTMIFFSIKIIPSLKQSHIPFFGARTIDPTGLKNIFKFAAPLVVISLLIHCGRELMTVLAGLISVETQAT